MYLEIFLSLQLTVDDLDTFKLDSETKPKSDGLENNCNIDQSPISTSDPESNNEKKHGLVCQFRGKLGMKSKLTPVVPFVKPESFVDEKEQNTKDGFISSDPEFNNEKKHGLVCQFRGKHGMKSKLTPVVPFIKPDSFVEEKEENTKGGFIITLMALKNTASSTPVKEFVDPNKKNKKGLFGLCRTTNVDDSICCMKVILFSF